MPPRSFMLATEIHEVDVIQTKVKLGMELHGGPAQQADEWRALLALHLFCRAVRGVLRGLYRQALADEVRGRSTSVRCKFPFPLLSYSVLDCVFCFGLATMCCF
jgi:hypothetical protein